MASKASYKQLFDSIIRDEGIARDAVARVDIPAILSHKQHRLLASYGVKPKDIPSVYSNYTEVNNAIQQAFAEYTALCKQNKKPLHGAKLSLAVVTNATLPACSTTVSQSHPNEFRPSGPAGYMTGIMERFLSMGLITDIPQTAAAAIEVWKKNRYLPENPP